jgi:hypothetical protein
MAASTRERCPSDMASGRLKKLETVPVETPALRATSTAFAPGRLAAPLPAL